MNSKERIRRSKTKLGPTTDLMPCVMGAIDAIWENSKNPHDNQETSNRSNLPKKTLQSGNFFSLSPNVQKILSNVPDEELNRTFGSEESLAFKRGTGGRYSSRKLSQEAAGVVSPSVQKMLSNLPDAELGNRGSFLHKNGKASDLRGSKSFCNSHQRRPQKGAKDLTASCSVADGLSAIEGSESVGDKAEDTFSPRPLGSYLHTSPSGIASRTPVGRKHLGKYLQVPSESSVGTNSTTSSEVSRPVSLTSLGSCSSSSSGGPHQPGSAYLASAESLDSDPEPAGSQGSADSGIAEQPTMSPEQMVLQEVMDTETVYVADLREVIEGYLECWRSTPDCPLFKHLEDLFSNLEEIYNFNRSFLQELQSAHCDPTLTANAFLHNDSGFSVYTEYCTHYPRTMDVLGELTRDTRMAALFRERQIALGHALPLGSYLLKPVQRILKYHVLLQRLSKECDSTHNPAVDLALTTMTSVASHINTMKRKHEHAVRVQEIQSQLYGWTGPDLTALGELVAEGTFRVGGARGRRHVFLFERVLLMAKNKQDGSLAYKAHIMCSNLMLVEQVRGEPLSFHILPFDNPRQQCTLRARSPHHKREWTLQLKRVILENYSAVIPSHARQLVMQLGQNVEEEDTSDKWSPLKQHSTPQYLERRSRVRKSRDFSNRRAASHDRSFASLTSWRRKSEPGVVQYNIKTLPKRITRIKKLKDQTAKFYTDLSDSENCETIGASMDSLHINNPQINEHEELEDRCENIQESSLEGENESHVASNTLEKVVSDLLMQNEEFHKLLNRQRRNIRESEPGHGNWKQTEEEDTLPAKADSLPRDFQLNDQLDGQNVTKKNESEFSSGRSVPEQEDLQENDLSSQLNDSEHPDHRIYRKSAIRFSLIQKFRTILSEEQKASKLPTYKQGSKSMGAKIAQPDYADPQKLFRSTQTLNRSDLNLNHSGRDEDLMGNRENLDMTINEKEVLSCCDKVKEELEKRLRQNPPRSSQGERVSNSSQNSDGYYESLMEKNLSEDLDFNRNNYVRTSSESYSYQGSNRSSASSYSLVYKRKTTSNSFGPSDEIRQNEGDKETTIFKNASKLLKRPTKAPPPIPTKPKFLTQEKEVNEAKTGNESDAYKRAFSSEIVYKISNQQNGTLHENGKVQWPPSSNSSWVKAMVGRFE